MKKISIFVALLAVGLGVFVLPAEAFHSWGNYHWARTSNPFTLKLGDNVSGAWDSVLATASSDWSLSSVIDTAVVTGLSSPKNCKPKYGRVEVCNNKYGNNGWLGLAQIWVTGGTHITQGVTKLNDTYFNSSTYNTVAWRNLVMCQEIGHTLGLDHQDENFNNTNLDTCMDYTRNPSTNQHPNTHDYEELEAIYAHLDTTTTISATLPSKNANSVNGIEVNPDSSSEWGRAIRQDRRGRSNVFERDLGRGNKVLTHIFWTD